MLYQVLRAKLFRDFNIKSLPFNYTISVTGRCNSRCSTCNIWKSEPKYELTFPEYEKIFKSLGNSPVWVTLSGGCPFLRKDLPEIAVLLDRTCHPKIINIPTNGIMTKRILSDVRKIVQNVKAQVVINVSIDGIGKEHDKIRGVPGNFDKAMKTFSELRKIRANNFQLGIHTVISRFNYGKIGEIQELAKRLGADSYITEIAEERVELTTDSTITPTAEQYEKAVSTLSTKPSNKLMTRITQAFRKEYYSLVPKILREKQQVIPCYAGFASCQITPTGDVWACCVRGDVMGNLRKTNYDFAKVWFSEKADRIRQSIRKGECHCPLANAHYSNMLCDTGEISKVAWNFFK